MAYDSRTYFAMTLLLIYLISYGAGKLSIDLLILYYCCPVKYNRFLFVNRRIEMTGHRWVFNEAHRILKPNAKAGIVHWHSDISTPRRPQLEIRPKPEQCKQWASETGFAISKEVILEPYHFGIIITKI